MAPRGDVHNALTSPPQPCSVEVRGGGVTPPRPPRAASGIGAGAGWRCSAVGECMQVEAGVGGVICHQGEPEDWQRVPREAAEVARLHDVEIGLWTGLYQVVDREQRSRRYLSSSPQLLSVTVG